jgi:hypothetical protein
MSDKKINFGLGPNTNTGDTNYEAFTKVEDRLEAAEAAIEEISAAVENVPSNIRGIKSVLLNESSHLIITFTDDTTQDAGLVGTGTSSGGSTGGGSTTPTTNPTNASFVSSNQQSQSSGTIRFFQAKLDRKAKLTAISNNGTIWDADNLIYSVTSATAGDGTTSGSVDIILTATPDDNSGAVTQTVSISISASSTPKQVSEHGSAVFTGDAGKKLETFAGWALYGNAGPSNYATDGDGAIVNDGTNIFNGSLLMSPSTASGLSGSLTFSRGTSDGQAEIALLSDGAGNAIVVELGFRVGDGIYSPDYFVRKDGSFVDFTNTGYSCPWDSSGLARLLYAVSTDKKTLKVGLGDINNGITIDLTQYPNLGAKFGLFSGMWYGNPALRDGAKLVGLDYAVQQSTLAITNAPGNTDSNRATYALTWAGTKPTKLQHSFDNVTWYTGDSTINSDGTASYVASAQSAGNKTIRIRMLNDTGIVALAPNRTRFLGPVAQFGVNVSYPGPYSPQFQVLDNLFYQGYWIRPGFENINDYAPDFRYVDADLMPLVSGMYRAIGRGPVSGGYMLMTWTGAPNMNVYQGHSEEASIDDESHPDAQSFKFRQNFTVGQPYNSFVSLGMDFDPANPPKNIRIHPVGQPASATEFVSDAYVNHHRNDYGPSYAGCLRAMDWLEVNNIRTEITFASIERRLNGLINLANAAKRDLWINVMPYASDDYVTKLVQTVNSKLDPRLHIYIEYGNEWWNGKFPIYGLLAARYRQRTGAANPQNGADEYGQLLAELVFQHNALMTKVESLIPNWQTRVVRVVNIQAGNAPQYAQFKETGGDHCDFVANAPYFNYVDPAGKTDPASIMAGWIAAGIAAIRDLRATADAVYADGRRFGCYEAGTGADGLDYASFVILKQSPQWYYVFRAYFEEWKNQYGDLLLNYDDMQSGWGLLNYQGSTTNYGVMAMTDAIAGNYAQRPNLN